MPLKDVWEELFENYLRKNEPKKKYKSVVTLKKLVKLKKLTRISKVKEE